MTEKCGQYLMGIDNGGTFSKAALFDVDGNQIAVSSRPTKVLTPAPGWVERDMEELWRTNAAVIREVLEKSGIDSGQVAAVSFSGHGKGLYVVGKEGEIICPGILSTDGRAWEYPKRWEEQGIAARVAKKTCQTVLACQPVSLLGWLKDHEPEVYEKIGAVFSVKDYVRYRLTGIMNGEYTDFSGGNLVNLMTGAYDREILEDFGIEEIYDRLPPLVRSAQICGRVTKESASLTGLRAGTPVTAGMFDVDACGIASGLVDESEMCMIAGTWSINEYLTRGPVTGKAAALGSMFCIPEYYLIEESSPTSAGNLEWFLMNLMPEEQRGLGKEALYDLVNGLVESVAPGDSGIVFLPFLNGSGENPQARGTFTGMSGYHSRAHMLRAVYEGVVFSHVTHVRRLLEHRERPERIRLSGGAVNSAVWVQMFADALQIPIAVVEGKELGAQGAAMAAGIGAGIYRDYQDAAARTVHITRTVLPRPEMAEIYQRKYRVYRKVSEALSGVWGEM